ncbi:hypothetical protein ACTFIY_006069 [Dictyostelium cf. discoideum]
MAPHGLTLLYIGKASHQNGRGLYIRGYKDLVDGPRFWGNPNANPPEMANAEVLMYYRGFDGPVAGHAEWWFLSVFGCPDNSFNEGGLKTSARGYGAGQWNFFHATAPAVNVRQYIIDETSKLSICSKNILRRIVNCEAEREALANQVPNLENQVAQFQNQVVNLQNANELLTNFNGYLAAALLNAMPQIPNLNAFLQVYGAGLSVSSEAIHNWNEARKNGGGGGGIGGGIGGVGDGKNGDGKNGDGKNGDGKNGDGKNGADDGWLKSGCVCPETPPCPVVIPCPEPVVCNIAKIQIQLNSTIKNQTQDWLTDCQKEYVKQTSHSSRDDTLISLRNCQAEYRKETFKKDKLCREIEANPETVKLIKIKKAQQRLAEQEERRRLMQEEKRQEPIRTYATAQGVQRYIPKPGNFARKRGARN